MELNDNVLALLFERLDIKNEIQLFNLLDLELLVITKGKRGALYLYKDEDKVKSISKVPKHIVNSVDTSGAGDAFFSSMLKEYAYNDVIDKNFIDRAFEVSNKASRDILMQFGSRKS